MSASVRAAVAQQVLTFHPYSFVFLLMAVPSCCSPRRLGCCSKEVPAFLQEVTSTSGQRGLAQPQLLARKQAAGGRVLLVPMAEMAAAFWGAAEGPGASMRAQVEADHSPARYKDVPRVGVGRGGGVTGGGCVRCIGAHA